ncbi:hypothetical protein D3C85_1477000 [compost metagenome]
MAASQLLPMLTCQAFCVEPKPALAENVEAGMPPIAITAAPMSLSVRASMPIPL